MFDIDVFMDNVNHVIQNRKMLQAQIKESVHKLRIFEKINTQRALNLLEGVK